MNFTESIWTILAVVALPRFVAGACPTVEAIAFKSSSALLRITTMFNGKVKDRASLELFALPDTARSLWSGSTDAKGVANLPVLPVGQYQVVAAGDHGLGATLYITVSPSAHESPATFSMNLRYDPTFSTIQQKLSNVDGKAASDEFKYFPGPYGTSRGRPWRGL